jgi:hypothetical protein
MNKSTIEQLEQESPEITRRRVIMLESLLERAGEIINTYAKDKWIASAEQEFAAYCPEDQPSMAKDFAENAWPGFGEATTKDFGYPIPPPLAEGAVEDEVSYWTG